LEINNAIYRFARGIEISEETINIDLIKKIGFGEEDNYLSSDQTLKYFKDILWDSEILDTSYRKSEYYKADEMDRHLLDRADLKWRDHLASRKEIELDADYKKKVEMVISRARNELLP
jgi:trimethylamine:corrinoid methyltransferase-like protein